MNYKNDKINYLSIKETLNEILGERLANWNKKSTDLFPDSRYPAFRAMVDRFYELVDKQMWKCILPADGFECLLFQNYRYRE